MNIIKEWSGTVALVILAIMGLSGLFKGNSQSFGTAVDCGSNTCISGGFGLTTGPFQVDGNSILNGNLTVTGTQTLSGVIKFSGAVYASSTLQVSGTQTHYGLTTLTGTTTLGAGLTATDATFGITAFATSTNTTICIAPSSLGATSTFAGTLYFTYGACN